MGKIQEVYFPEDGSDGGGSGVGFSTGCSIAAGDEESLIILSSF